MPTFGVVVFSVRGMKQLAECLKSVAWADEVLLVHAGGGDPEIGGGEFPTLRIRSVGSLAEARNYFGEIRTDWVLHLWGDERLEAGLADELRALCRDVSRNSSPAYRIRVQSYILRRWVEGSLCGPGPAVRLVRDASEIPLGWWAEASSHGLAAQGWIGAYGCSELSDAVERVQGLSDFWADSARAAPSPPGPMKSALWSLRVFIKMLLLNRFFSRGLAGITLSALASYAVLLSGAKLWEARHVKRRA